MSTRIAKGSRKVGRFSVDLELANFTDVDRAERGELPKNEVRRVTLSGVVDPGATKLVLPEAVVKRLGLRSGEKIKVKYADGRTAQRRTAQGVFLQLLGRYSTFTAIVEPKWTTALIGAIVFEDLDLLVDCAQQRVVPRDPSGAVYEIE